MLLYFKSNRGGKKAMFLGQRSEVLGLCPVTQPTVVMLLWLFLQVLLVLQQGNNGKINVKMD